MAHPLFSARKLLEDTRLKTCLRDLGDLAGPLDAPPKPKDILMFTTKTTVAEALKALAASNILSAPVSDAMTKEYVGMLDVMDILGGFLHTVYPELLTEGFTTAHKRLSMTELQALGIEFGSHTITSMLHGGDLWYRGDAESTLMEVVESGFRVSLPPKVHSPHHHLRVHHRIAVFDILPGEQTPDGPIPEWRITNIVSQTDVLRLLAAKAGTLGGVLEASLESLGLVQGADAVSTVSASTPALEVFAKMQKEKLSGVGVVGEGLEKEKTRKEGAAAAALLGNLSASDLRGLTPERFGALALPLGTFLLLMHPSSSKDAVKVTWEDALLDALPAVVKEQRWAEAFSGLPPLIKCSPQATLREALELLVSTGKHRVYVCDDSGCAVGVVTPTDVLRSVAMRGEGEA